jgi:toxin ParE1/3/4
VKVRFTPTGRAQFLDAGTYIFRYNPSTAVKFREKAEKVLSRLKTHPESGRLIPKFPDLPFCEVIVRPYRFFYKIKGDTVWLIAVWHSAQLPEEPEEAWITSA